MAGLPELPLDELALEEVDELVELEPEDAPVAPDVLEALLPPVPVDTPPVPVVVLAVAPPPLVELVAVAPPDPGPVAPLAMAPPAPGPVVLLVPAPPLPPGPWPAEAPNPPPAPTSDVPCVPPVPLLVVHDANTAAVAKPVAASHAHPFARGAFAAIFCRAYHRRVGFRLPFALLQVPTQRRGGLTTRRLEWHCAALRAGRSRGATRQWVCGAARSRDRARCLPARSKNAPWGS